MIKLRISILIYFGVADPSSPAHRIKKSRGKPYKKYFEKKERREIAEMVDVGKIIKVLNLITG